MVMGTDETVRNTCVRNTCVRRSHCVGISVLEELLAESTAPNMPGIRPSVRHRLLQDRDG